jgi:TM2 domain-containing membrane protein YozV
LSNADKRMDRIITSFLLTFFGVVGAGLLILWLVGWNKIFYQVVVPELLLGSFLFALLTALSIGAFLHHRN